MGRGCCFFFIILWCLMCFGIISFGVYCGGVGVGVLVWWVVVGWSGGCVGCGVVRFVGVGKLGLGCRVGGV